MHRRSCTFAPPASRANNPSEHLPFFCFKCRAPSTRLCRQRLHLPCANNRRGKAYSMWNSNLDMFKHRSGFIGALFFLLRYTSKVRYLSLRLLLTHRFTSSMPQLCSRGTSDLTNDKQEMLSPVAPCRSYTSKYSNRKKVPTKHNWLRTPIETV